MYQVNQELISYGTYGIDSLMKIIDTVVNLNNRTTTVEKELHNRTLYYDMGQVQNYQYSVNCGANYTLSDNNKGVAFKY